MRVVHLSYYYGGGDVGGASVAATRIHQALLNAHVDSHYVCAVCKESGVNVHVIPKARCLYLLFYVLTRSIWLVSRLISGRVVMPNFIPIWGFGSVLKELNPDIVHLHSFFQDFLSFGQLCRVSAPVVFTLHDLLIISSMNSHPDTDVRVDQGFTSANSSILERWLWRRKFRLVEQLCPTFTGPSKWACERFQSSFIGRGHDVAMITNPLSDAFGYVAQRRMPHRYFTILYGACGGRSEDKGWPELVSALALLPVDVRKDIVVNVFGEDAADCVCHDVRIHFLGVVKDVKRLVEIHHSSDVFAFPSRKETQGQVKIEALADGLPVLAFDRTACADGIVSGVNGWVAHDGDVSDYAAGILHYYSLFKDGKLEGLRTNISVEALGLYSGSVVAQDLSLLYLKIVHT